MLDLMRPPRFRTGVCVIRVESGDRGGRVTIRMTTDIERPGGETVQIVATADDAVRVIRAFLVKCGWGAAGSDGSTVLR
jgi:hypothetical protein